MAQSSHGRHGAPKFALHNQVTGLWPEQWPEPLGRQKFSDLQDAGRWNRTMSRGLSSPGHQSHQRMTESQAARPGPCSSPTSSPSIKDKCAGLGESNFPLKIKEPLGLDPQL